MQVNIGKLGKITVFSTLQLIGSFQNNYILILELKKKFFRKINILI